MVADQKITLTETVRCRVPPELVAALNEAAVRNYTNVSEIVRRAMVEKVRELGVPLPEPSTRSRLVQNT